MQDQIRIAEDNRNTLKAFKNTVNLGAYSVYLKKYLFHKMQKLTNYM